MGNFKTRLLYCDSLGVCVVSLVLTTFNHILDVLLII